MENFIKQFVDFEKLLPLLVLFVLLMIDRNGKLQFTRRDRNLVVLEMVFRNAIVFLLNYAILGFLIETFGAFELLSISNIEGAEWVIPVIAFLAIDLILYTNHWLHHRVSWLWKLHRLHHSDRSLDTLTTYLHHPLEFVSGYFVLVLGCLLLDIPLNVLAMYGFVSVFFGPFMHFKKLLPANVDRVVSKVFVTPNFHKSHHSMDYTESNANYGFIFTFWDAMFRTKHSVSFHSLKNLETGIDDIQMPANFHIKELLANPFK